MTTEKAKLLDGRTIEYLPDIIGSGVMKETVFTADKQSVICFYLQSQDHQRLERLEAVVGKFNPTTEPLVGDYWKARFAWPSGIVVKPRLGILAPAYPKKYYFQLGTLKGKEKEGKWFSGKTAGGRPLRQMVDVSERGTWINYFAICVNLARAVRRLHSAGLAHSDLSSKNVLIDPDRGDLCVTDIDSLVIPQMFPPDVMGTRGYIAPEVVATKNMMFNDKRRFHPSALTDQHAMAVLIYEYLLQRHPLHGPKIHPAPTAEEQEDLEAGLGATFIEHPADHSNRPADLKVLHSALGPQLSTLFTRAFVDGLHKPDLRPAASDWERALVHSWDLLVPCANPRCEQRYFVLHDSRKVHCPFCGTHSTDPFPVLNLCIERGPGNWRMEWQLAIHPHQALMRWHAVCGIFPNEHTDRTIQARFSFHNGKWYMHNEKLQSLSTATGQHIPPGQAFELVNGATLRLSNEPSARLAQVHIIHP